MDYKFIYNDKEYELREDNCSYMMNDEEFPVSGIDKADVIDLLNHCESVDFDIAYYDKPCENCLAGKKEKEKHFKFLEYHFYIFTKAGKYIMSSLSKEYAAAALKKLYKRASIDNSYALSVAVCTECGYYSIELEHCEV